MVTSFKKYPQEKNFVHTNQPVYSNGETIWYKVYTMAYGKPSALSKIITGRPFTGTPEINTDNTGNLKFRFYNSDKARQFKITLQGMEADGRLVYLEKTVQ